MYKVELFNIYFSLFLLAVCFVRATASLLFYVMAPELKCRCRAVDCNAYSIAIEQAVLHSVPLRGLQDKNNVDIK